MTKYERSIELSSVVIYDSKCPYCSAVTKWIKRTHGLGAISWHEKKAQEFLNTQFNYSPFAVFLVVPSEGTIYAGPTAAKELCNRANLPELFGRLVKQEYHKISKTASVLSNRKQDLDKIEGKFILNPDALSLLEGLFHEAWTLPFEK
tara:strand:+ start:9162 stop:9605 length:444 start_codon:yes stop_codon:yes gene_type:complete